MFEILFFFIVLKMRLKYHASWKIFFFFTFFILLVNRKMQWTPSILTGFIQIGVFFYEKLNNIITLDEDSEMKCVPTSISHFVDELEIFWNTEDFIDLTILAIFGILEEVFMSLFEMVIFFNQNIMVVIIISIVILRFCEFLSGLFDL